MKNTTRMSLNSKTKWILLSIAVLFLLGLQVYANNQSQLNQAISDGTISVDIVDSGGTTVASPAVTFGAEAFSFDTQDATGTLGTSSERLRVYNPTATATWTVNLAGSATTATWSTGSTYYDFNDPSGYTDGADTDSYGGQMTVDPSSATLAGVSGCATTNVSKGTSDDFEEGTTNSIDLMSAAAGAPTYCRWDLTGVGMTQKLPAAQTSGNYSVNMVLTIL